MNELAKISIAIEVLEYLRTEAGSIDKFINKAIDATIVATHKSLEDEENTRPEDILESFSKEPYASIYKDLMKSIVMLDKLEIEHKMTSKRKDLLAQQLKLEVEERYDLDDVRISHALGAVIRLTDEDKQQAENKANDSRRLIVQNVHFLIESDRSLLAAFTNGDTPKGFEDLRKSKELEPFFADMIDFLVGNDDGEHGLNCKLISDILEDPDTCDKVLESENTSKPVEFFAQMVKHLRKAEQMANS
jgi:hypothetical protein